MSARALGLRLVSIDDVASSWWIKFRQAPFCSDFMALGARGAAGRNSCSPEWPGVLLSTHHHLPPLEALSAASPYVSLTSAAGKR
jgi:hypothetical protein